MKTKVSPSMCVGIEITWDESIAAMEDINSYIPIPSQGMKTPCTEWEDLEAQKGILLCSKVDSMQAEFPECVYSLKK